MAIFQAHKVVVNLPDPLESDTLYLVRTGVGFDLYCSDTTGSIAYKVNDLTSSDILSALLTVDGSGSGLDADTLDGRQSTDFSLSTYNVEILSAQKNLGVNDARYQFLSNATTQIVNLPDSNTVGGKEFIIINTNSVDIAIYEDGVDTQILLGEGGRLTCYSVGSRWELFLDYQINNGLNGTSVIDGGVF